ncbi:MAG: adenylate/guanylate cyclase domain-containing protein [Geobacter sp.]|nr:MAG: adenylate/guanylate cyclase domain-containing protein [Geobacter sp.]
MPFFSRFRLTLVQKLIASFVLNGICMITALVFAITELGTMHRIAADIAHNDLVSAVDTISLQETLLAQERAAGRFLILKYPEFKQLYESQADLFRQKLAAIQQHSRSNVLGELIVAYNDYTALCSRIFVGEKVSESSIKNSVERVEQALERVRNNQKKILEHKLNMAGEREAQAATWALGLAMGGVTIAFVVAGLLIYSFSSSIGKLQKATHRIAAGDFDHDPHIPPGDEIGSLSQDFMLMAARLKELEQISLDASPLTRLPGNIAIERVLNRRLRERVSFAMCYLDLDNFKSYNDRYGYIRASELIKEAGEVIHKAVKRLDDPGAFVGHIGGDDFVVIISTELAAMACQSIIMDFDAIIPIYYSEEDRVAGSFEGVDRYGVARSFPLISISIAALVCEPGDYASAAEIATAAAKFKDQVKESAGSNYIIVREAEHIEV